MTSERKVKLESTVLADLISRLEVSAVGIASVAGGEGTKLEETALRLLPQAHSVVVFAMEIYPEVLDLTSPGKTMGVASLNDLLVSHDDYLCGRLTKVAYDIAKTSRSASLKALPLPARGCPMDTRFLEAVFSYKHAGQAAGLGNIGWHSLLITPGFGPRVRLSCCLTEAELESTTAVNESFECDSCRICLRNCPAGALAKPRGGKQYTINKFACCSFRNASGGCAECMRLCPIGR